jgi:hypothetical protein
MGADLIYGEVWHWMGRFLFKVTSGMPDCSIHLTPAGWILSASCQATS